MGESEHLADLVDALLAAEKTLGGTADWQYVYNLKEPRIVWPLLFAGETNGWTLQATYQVHLKPPIFTIGIYTPRPIWRLDHDPYAGHYNNPARPPHLPANINGPHVHTWPDNRQLCTGNSIPEKLRFASELPANVRTFENAFRWFCAETKIRLGAVDVPSAPTPRTLL